MHPLIKALAGLYCVCFWLYLYLIFNLQMSPVEHKALWLQGNSCACLVCSSSRMSDMPVMFGISGCVWWSVRHLIVIPVVYLVVGGRGVILLSLRSTLRRLRSQCKNSWSKSQRTFQLNDAIHPRLCLTLSVTHYVHLSSSSLTYIVSAS